MSPLFYINSLLTAPEPTHADPQDASIDINNRPIAAHTHFSDINTAWESLVVLSKNNKNSSVQFNTNLRIRYTSSMNDLIQTIDRDEIIKHNYNHFKRH